MKKANGYFILGSITAFLCFALLANNQFIGNLYAELLCSSLPRELRLGSEIGIIDQNQLSSKQLRSTISRGKFSQLLARTLNLLGNSKIENASQLAQSGIFNGSPSRNRISRKTTIEAICRAAIYMADKKAIKFTNEKPARYRDYIAPEKYQRALNYLQKKYILRGYSNGFVGAKRYLSLKEAVYFLFRFYEAVSSDLMNKNKNITGIKFVDISTNHPIMRKVNALTSAGAFDIVKLRPSLDGNSFITAQDLALIAEGILKRNQKNVDLIRMKTIFAGKRMSLPANRRELALVMEYLISSLEKNSATDTKAYKYKDVKENTPEAEALSFLTKHNIILGYPNGVFAGSERITWFESIGLIYEVTKSKVAASPVKTQRLAVRSDIERFEAILKAKKARIRKILSKRPRYHR